jgi:hypothetical protein
MFPTQCEYKNLDLPCKLCHERGFVCGERDKVLGPSALVTAEKSRIPETSSSAFIHRRLDTPVDEALTDLDRRYLSTLGQDAMSAYFDGTFHWRGVACGKNNLIPIQLPIFPLSSKPLRFSLLAYAASISTAPLARVHALEYMEKFLRHGKSQDISNSEVCLAAYMAFSFEHMQSQKHPLYVQNMVVNFQGFVGSLGRLIYGMGKWDFAADTFFQHGLRPALFSLVRHIAMPDTVITQNMVDTVLNLSRTILHFLDIFPHDIDDFVFFSYGNIFDLCLKLFEINRLHPDWYNLPDDCQVLLRTTLRRSSKLSPMHSICRADFLSRVLIYEFVVMRRAMRSSEQYATEAKELCRLVYGHLSSTDGFTISWAINRLFRAGLCLQRSSETEPGIFLSRILD